LSYASDDAVAAERVCSALRAAGIEVWFDKSELRGGDAWDAAIRSQIKTCALFIPVISSNTQARGEGYFRLEWKLAVDRSHLMAADQAFLLPIVIDETADAAARVPDRFREVQWTRLPGGETPPAFTERVLRLLGADPTGTAPAATRVSAGLETAGPGTVSSSWKVALVATITVALLAIGYLVAKTLAQRSADARTEPQAVAGRGPAYAFNPPPHSIAVLPFVNMSADKDQEYFSDGLTEELLNSLAEISGLHVAARTSAFSFKGKDTDIATIARKLNVGAVLEGSVRRSAHTIRITAQLINAVTGFHLWSKTYDRDPGDVLKLQTEIAASVAEALKVALLADVSARIELAGTRNFAAFDAYLRGLKLARIAAATTPMQCQAPIDAFSEAITLDASFALAYANRAFMTLVCADNSRDWLRRNEQAARADAERAIALAPGSAEGYLALSRLEQGLFKFEPADEACARALALGPGNVQVLDECSLLAAYFGHADTGISGARHAVDLDPLNPLSHRALGDTLRYARRYQDAISAYQASIASDPEHSAEAYALRGLSFYLAGDLASAQSSCETRPDYFRSEVCRAVIYDRLGRHGDAASVLAKVREAGGDAAAYQYAEIFAQWGDRRSALDWLEKAMTLGDPGLVYTKVDPLMDPLRKEPRFQAVVKELKYPR
jgi:TolB-like protein/tetratricopeptide (TPR) repeat protein